MSELRNPGAPDDADRPAATDRAADAPVARPRLEIRTADMDPERPVDRPGVTAAQRYYSDLVKQAGDVPPVSDTDVVYVRDWASGESLDHKYPHIAGDEDSTERGLPHLDAAAVFQSEDDGWDEIVTPTDERPGADFTTPAGIPDALEPGDVRSTSMTISEARDQVTKTADPPPDFHRDSSRLEAKVGEIEDDWYDRLDGPQTEETDSRVKSLVKRAAQSSDSILQIVGDNTDISADISGRPPTQPAVRHIPPSSDMPNPVHAPPGVDAATAVTSALLTVGAVGSMVYHKFESRKDRHGGNG